MALKPAEEMLNEALAAWNWGGTVVGAVRYGAGHINDTFCVYTQTAEGDCVRFILQRINTNTFTDPAGLMENICGVTGFLRKKIEEKGGDVARETMNVVPTADGKPYYADTNGGAWRVYTFVEGTVCLQKVESPDDFYASAYAFGQFQQLLADYPASTLHETIARFHDTANRYANFEKALEADVCGRAKDVQAEIEFVKAHKADCSYMVDLLAAGKLPLRVTHNDTKLNNILFDEATGKGLCIIDLDTIMPGLAASDFGDSIRFGASTAAEDEKDLSKVHFDIELFRLYAKGYLETAGSVLTSAEKKSLAWGAKLLTLECGMRFLTDYLQGDTYFKTTHPTHNLERARTQFKLVDEMEHQFEAMQAIVAEYC